MSVPLDQPHYGIGPAGMVRFLRKYATFRGRASRSEFWWGQLTLFIISTVLTAPGLVVYVLGSIELFGESLESSSTTTTMPESFELLLAGMGLMLVGGFLNLGVLVPHLALTWRRLQDAGLHGALAFAFIGGGWALGSVVPFAGFAYLVPGFLTTSLKGARFEQSATPALPPGVDAATWQAMRAWTLAVAQGYAPQAWPTPQQWPAQQVPTQQWPQHPQQSWPHPTQQP